MAGGICVDLESLVSGEILGRLQELGTQGDGFAVSLFEIIYPQIEMDLLGRSMRPVRLDVFRRELKAHSPVAIDHQAVPVIVGLDGSVKQTGPEAALGIEVGCVEDHNHSGQFHSLIVLQIRPKRKGSTSVIPGGATRERVDLAR